MKPWVRNMIVWLLIGLFMLVTLSFASLRSQRVLCSQILVTVTDSMRNQFITAKDIEQHVHTLEKKIMGEPLDQINTRTIEHSLKKMPAIESVEAYVDVEGALHIEVQQRTPIVRIVNEKGESYYLDAKGYIIPLQDSYTPLVLVANGHIVENFEWQRQTTIFGKRQQENQSRTLQEVYRMALHIHKDAFWSKQIEQVYVNRKGEYELIPRVGAHLILLGEADNFDSQLDQLWAFYQQGLNKVGWNRYEIINLKFRNQIVCTKK
jgi:cell division protein FtsQ